MKVLYLCTGNSCRSQMAEAITNHFRSGIWEAVSAGTKPAGYVHPKAIQVLQEIKIDHRGESKHVDQFLDSVFDLVITVCDDADEKCPVWLGKGNKVHIGFYDPALEEGSEDEVLKVFRDVRNQIKKRILIELDKFSNEHEDT